MVSSRKRFPAKSWADGAWGVHSTTDLASLSDQIESTTRLAKAVAKRRAAGERPKALAEVPIIQDETHWRSKLDVRHTELDQKMELMNDIYRGASGHDDIVSVRTGWSDEHIHTELMTTEGMDRVWSFQRSLIHGMVTDSCLDGKLGQNIGNDLVTVVDDPTLMGGYGAYPVDDEGVNTREKVLIKNGVLTEYLNHRETAHHFGVDPNGGARAQDGLHHPLVRMSNTMIHGGTHADIDELMEDVQYGVYACGTRGGQVDTGRGSCQFAAQEAWLIENGELTRPLKDVSVSGLTLEILKNVDGLTRDASLASPGFCGKGQTVPVGDGGPVMRISEALVG